MRLTWIFAAILLQTGTARAEKEGITAKQIMQSSYPERFKRAALRPFRLKEKDGAAKVKRQHDDDLSGITVTSHQGKGGLKKVLGTAFIRRDERGFVLQHVRGLMLRSEAFDSAGNSREVRRSVTPFGSWFVEQVQHLFHEAVSPGGGVWILRMRGNKYFLVDGQGKRLRELQPDEAEAARSSER